MAEREKKFSSARGEGKEEKFGNHKKKLNELLIRPININFGSIKPSESRAIYDRLRTPRAAAQLPLVEAGSGIVIARARRTRHEDIPCHAMFAPTDYRTFLAFTCCSLLLLISYFFSLSERSKVEKTLVLLFFSRRVLSSHGIENSLAEFLLPAADCGIYARNSTHNSIGRGESRTSKQFEWKGFVSLKCN
jgi:hypothetical protein